MSGAAVFFVELMLVRNTGRAAGVGYVGFLTMCVLDTAWALIIGATVLGSMVALRAPHTARGRR